MITVDGGERRAVVHEGRDQTVDEDSGCADRGGVGDGISSGPADERARAVSFVVSNDNAGLFSGQPSLASDGTLTYTLKKDATVNGNCDCLSPTTPAASADGGIENSALANVHDQRSHRSTTPRR